MFLHYNLDFIAVLKQYTFKSVFQSIRDDMFNVEKLGWDSCGRPTERSFSELVKGGLVESHFNGVSFFLVSFGQ